MGIQDLQIALENEGVGVDLFRIARHRPEGYLRLMLDAEGCLPRLYGGYFSDWVCGGQWARCMHYLNTLTKALRKNNVSLCVCFNGVHPIPPALPTQWIQTQAIYRQRVNSVLRHILVKGTPPPKVLWVPPVGLYSCLRKTLRYLNIPIMVSSEDHCQEVVRLCWKENYAGLVGCSGEYLVYQPPRYFNSTQLKMDNGGSSLQTKEYMLHELHRILHIPQEQLCLMGALLGGNILSEQSLTDFYIRLRINRKKISSEALVRRVCQFVREMKILDIDAACIEIFGDLNDPRAAKLKQAVQYYHSGAKNKLLKFRTALERRSKKTTNDQNTVQPRPSTSSYEPSQNCINEQLINEDNYPSVPVEVLRSCAERHAKGLITPQMLSILTHRYITLPVLMEDDKHGEIPSIHHVFRPIRQSVYAILYNMHQHHFMAQKDEENGTSVTNDRSGTVHIAEWIYSDINPGKTPEVVPGVVLDWPVPTVQTLWFGTARSDIAMRMRAFLSCMRSDNPLMINTSYVPHHLLILATVLRFILTSETPILRRKELDAIIFTAFTAEFMDMFELQNLNYGMRIDSRGIQLGALVMAGIETAYMVNEACGTPVPWLITNPFLLFDGILLQRSLRRASHCKTLVELCNEDISTVVKVERFRKAIQEDLTFEFAIRPLDLPLVRPTCAAAVEFERDSAESLALKRHLRELMSQFVPYDVTMEEPVRPMTITINGKTVRHESIDWRSGGTRIKYKFEDTTSDDGTSDSDTNSHHDTNPNDATRQTLDPINEENDC